MAIGTATNPAYQSYVAAFVEALQQLGWVDGRNASIEIRWGSGDANLEKTFAAELVGLAPDVILAAGTANLTFLQRATQSIPIVFVQVSDPVAQHFVASLTHPGANLTGFAAFEFSIGSKWIEMLKQVAPALARVAVIFNPDTSPQNEFLLRAIEADAAAVAVQIVALRIHTHADIEPALASFSREPNGALIVPTDNFMILRETFISELAIRNRLPAISGNGPSFVKAGGLMYYGYNVGVIGQYRQAAGYTDRILKGAKSGELPVQLPTKYDFVVNLKTAKALGLTVPQTLLVAADEVIE